MDELPPEDHDFAVLAANAGSEHIKCLIFDSEMCTVQKVGGEDRSESVLNAIQIHLQGCGCGLSKKQTVVGVVRVVAIQIHLHGWGWGLSKK